MKDKTLNIEIIQSPRFPNSIKSAFIFLPKLFLALIKLFLLSKKTSGPDAIIGFGGYSSFPSLLFGYLRKKPIFLCEQNAIPGQVTRLFSSVANEIFQSFPEIGLNPKEKFTGNPLRPPFSETSSPARKVYKKVSKILIIGGSQGARDLNNLYLELACNPIFSKTIFTLSTGPTLYNQIKHFTRKKDIVVPFIQDMKSALLENDLIIARAGSGTIYEILWAKIPSLLIPFPFAKDNHQSKNAQAVEKLNLAMVFDQSPFQPKAASEFLVKAIEEGKLTYLYKNLKQKHLFPLDAHKEIANKVLSEMDK